MGMNIQKSAGIKADTFILKRNNMDRWIRMDVAMLIILAICTRLVAGIMNVEKMDAYTGSGEGFCKAVSESHGVDMVKDCFELGTQKVLDVKKTAKSVCKSVTIKKTMQDVIRPTETEEIIPEVLTLSHLPQNLQVLLLVFRLWNYRILRQLPRQRNVP